MPRYRRDTTREGITMLAAPNRRARRLVAACCAIVLAVMVTAGASGASADPAGATTADNQVDLADATLQGVLRTTDRQTLEASVRQAQRTVADQAAQAPETSGSASIVFDTGMTAPAVSDFLSKRGLDLFAVEAKIPVGTTGEVYTVWLNDVARQGATPAQQLERATGAARFRFFQNAVSAIPAQRSELRAVAGGDFRFYRAEVVATNARLAATVGAPLVRAVLPDAGDRKVTALRAAQAARATTAAGSPIRLSSGDPSVETTKADTPVRTDTGQVCQWRQAGTLACQPDPGNDAAQLGVETTAATKAQQRVDGSVTPQDDSSLWTACNSAADSQNCPNDNTYRPHANTGGLQDFGVAIANYGANTYFWACYIEWVPDPYAGDGANGYWRTVCYPYAVSTVPFTYGVARWISRWGTRMTHVASVNQDRYISTLAFKSGAGLQPCIVNQFLGTAECSRALQNSVWLVRPGIEDELLVDNPACHPSILFGRQGTEADWNNGCFYPTIAATNLPLPVFLDTTFADGATPWDLSIDTANPAGIVEGVTYSNYAEFMSYNNNDMRGQHAFHAVSIDSRENDSFACTTHHDDNAFCYFPVDSSRVSDILPFI
jgi:hypothetical protein